MDMYYYITSLCTGFTYFDTCERFYKHLKYNDPFERPPLLSQEGMLFTHIERLFQCLLNRPIYINEGCSIFLNRQEIIISIFHDFDTVKFMTWMYGYFHSNSNSHNIQTFIKCVVVGHNKDKIQRCIHTIRTLHANAHIHAICVHSFQCTFEHANEISIVLLDEYIRKHKMKYAYYKNKVKQARVYILKAQDTYATQNVNKFDFDTSSLYMKRIYEQNHTQNLVFF